MTGISNGVAPTILSSSYTFTAEVTVPEGGGEGVIITLEGSGEDARAQVNFGRHGVKWLALAIAKLTPVD
jgi:hypothetical protein